MTQLWDSRSLGELTRTHPDLVKVLDAARQRIDFKVIQSTRSQEQQELDFKDGRSHAHWGQSAHDFSPSYAVDCIPVPLDWKNIKSFIAVADVVKACAKELNISVTYGGDWISIKDYPHFELSDWKERAKNV